MRKRRQYTFPEETRQSTVSAMLLTSGVRTTPAVHWQFAIRAVLNGEILEDEKFVQR